ncbi:hypothetical protein SCHPADRAFT_613629 [Schizopora paradoxa]|uniref:Putative zinc-finger domain-containing protein n=1 Tax=Schizopora paradoxa TaxID=27342 RepID=A0A0H2RA95_9AGAM|nr:hypothetical protein SCHPADRAFT_613629 [Schizopora paradoxa]
MIISTPNLRPLRDQVMQRRVGRAREQRLCRFEVGGGSCHDKTCDDLHVGDFEPSDKDIALYLLDSTGGALRLFNEGEIVSQLAQARQRLEPSQGNLEEVVADALSSLAGKTHQLVQS